MADFIQEFFANSITKFSGYNVVNTVVYFAVLAFVAFFVVFPLLKKKGIRFDFNFALSVLPFVLLGSSARILEDLRIFPRSANPLEFGFYTISPGIYIAVGLFTIAALFFSIRLSGRLKKNFLHVFGAIGLFSALPFFLFGVLRFTETTGFFLSVAVAAGMAFAAWFSMKKWSPQLAENRLNFLVIAGQALEGTTTYISTQLYSCGQVHGFSNIILGSVPLLFPLLKLLLGVAVIYSLDSEMKDKQLAGFIKLVLVILSFAMGTRNALTLGVGTCSAQGMAMQN